MLAIWDLGRVSFQSKLTVLAGHGACDHGGVGVERWRWVEKNKGPRCLRFGIWEKSLLQKPKGHGACDLGFWKR